MPHYRQRDFATKRNGTLCEAIPMHFDLDELEHKIIHLVDLTDQN